MFDFWDKELSEEETEALIDKAVAEITRRGMVTPAILALEMHKPLAFLGSQAAVAFAPFMVPFFGFDFVNNYSRLFSKRENIEKLLEKLESQPKPAKGSTEDSCPNT